MSAISKLFRSIKNNGIRKTIDVLLEKRHERRLQKIDKLPIKNRIVFECQSDMDDNPRAIYEYMLAQGYNKKYQLVWIVNNVVFCKKNYRAKNVVFINRFDKSRRNQRRLREYLSTAKWLLFSHPYWYDKIKPEQTVVHTGHGTPLKNSSAQKEDFWKKFDYMLVATPQTEPFYLKFWQCKKEQGFFCGNPRNDFLFTDKREEILAKLFPCTSEDKVIMCMPTYRKSTMLTDSVSEDKFALGVVKTEEQLLQLNDFLVKQKMHIIVKMHPLQTLDGQYLQSLSNIHYVVNKELFEKKILLYELLGCCDALLTDFSSVFFDYLVLNRPIAFFMNGFEDYQRGFIMDNPLEYMPGKKVNDIEDLQAFLQDVAQNRDEYKHEREKVNGWVNLSNYADNSQRFVEQILKK